MSDIIKKERGLGDQLFKATALIYVDKSGRVEYRAWLKRVAEIMDDDEPPVDDPRFVLARK